MRPLSRRMVYLANFRIDGKRSPVRSTRSSTCLRTVETI